MDLVFSSSSQLRAIAEVYAQSDGAARFVCDFAAAWVNVIEADASTSDADNCAEDMVRGSF